MMVAAGLVLLVIGIHRPVVILLDGIPQQTVTSSLSVRGILRDAGLNPGELDQVSPGLDQWVGWNAVVRVERARQFQVWLTPGGLSQPFQTPDRIAENVLLQVGLRIFPGDRVALNGQFLSPGKPLPPMPVYVLQVLRAEPLRVEVGRKEQEIYTAAFTADQGLWQAGVRLLSLDAVDTPLNSPVAPGMVIHVRQAVPFQIQMGSGQVQALTSADRTGAALVNAGVSLQGLDYSVPAEDQPLPPDRKIRVVRVREEVQLQQTRLPFQSEVMQDPETDLDQTRVIQPGLPGIKVTRVRVRYEDGVETSRQTEGEWVAQAPRDEKIGKGTRVASYTLDTPDGPIQYWRAVQVYATSYSPCESGQGKCYTGTSLGLPVRRGVIAVTKTWYRLFAGLQVYIPGYGKAVIADIGAGIPGQRWIDLGFTDADFEAWHQNVTLYFLLPAPANIPLEIP
jgi:resuscitation-promoting factor RpfB